MKKEFTLKKEHLLLLQSACVESSDAESGSPCIDSKRPYGNSFVAGDVAEILGWTLPEYDTTEYRDMTEEAVDLHHETTYALQILLQTPGEKVKIGNYQWQIRKGYEKGEWVKTK